jgi:hypothetical protein
VEGYEGVCVAVLAAYMVGISIQVKVIPLLLRTTPTPDELTVVRVSVRKTYVSTLMVMK